MKNGKRNITTKQIMERLHIKNLLNFQWPFKADRGKSGLQTEWKRGSCAFTGTEGL